MKMLPNARPWLGFKLPLAIATVAIAAPAQAATFAQSSTQSLLSNFRVNGHEVSPLTAFLDAENEAIATGDVSLVAADSVAGTFFEEQPPLSETLAEGFSEGSGTLPYLVQTSALTEAEVSFSVNGLFEFDFSSLLDLETAVDDNQSERAAAFGDIQLSLFHETAAGPELIDHFFLSGLTDSNSDEDVLEADYSDNFHILPPASDCAQANDSCVDNFFGGDQEFAYALLDGSYQRDFHEPTVLRLEKRHLSLTEVQEVPETSNILALALLGCGGLLLRRGSVSTWARK